MRILVQCSTKVARNAVRRETIDGEEHIIVSSSTLPDNVVMNGGLYPAEEIEKSYKSLERTLAPVEHPVDSEGRFLSASDPSAIHNFYAGAFNANVRRENGRVYLDKVINVKEAEKTERGRRLLARVNELETDPDAQPIHTSTGVFLDVEELDEPKTNAAGKQYTWVASNMTFDHDAILLDSVGAAQPHEGVGMAVNRKGEQHDVKQCLLANEDEEPGELSFEELGGMLQEALNKPPLRCDYVSRVYPSRVIYSLDDQLFEVPYVVSDGRVTISGIPLPVKRVETFNPTTNQESDAMRNMMLKALADAGVTVNADITDEELLAKYNAHLASQQNSNDAGAGDDKAELADVVANAMQPLVDRIGNLEQKLSQNDAKELNELADIVGNSDVYKGLDVEAAKKLGVDTLRGMAANCGTSHGVPLNTNSAGAREAVSYDMPE